METSGEIPLSEQEKEATTRTQREQQWKAYDLLARYATHRDQYPSRQGLTWEEFEQKRIAFLREQFESLRDSEPPQSWISPSPEARKLRDRTDHPLVCYGSKRPLPDPQSTQRPAVERPRNPKARLKQR